MQQQNKYIFNMKIRICIQRNNKKQKRQTETTENNITIERYIQKTEHKNLKTIKAANNKTTKLKT